MSIPLCNLRVEQQLTNPPKPVGLAVFDESGKIIGVMTYETAKQALDIYERLLEDRRLSAYILRQHKEAENA